MEIYFEAAKGLECPLIILDQFYYPWLLPPRNGVSLVLLYALASFWGEELRQLSPPYEITPPFIEAVTPKGDLPVPAAFRDSPWITLVAYDDYVLHKGLELLARLKAKRSIMIAISSDPENCRTQADEAGLQMDRLLTLALQDDANAFGFFAASKISIVSNGFLQIMEVLAMGCPVIALERGSGIGMSELNIAEQFIPYASFNETSDQQAARLEKWLDADPFPSALAARLKLERHGCTHCANRIEEVYRHSHASKIQSSLGRWFYLGRAL
jgi:hypothetical protein